MFELKQNTSYLKNKLLFFLAFIGLLNVISTQTLVHYTSFKVICFIIVVYKKKERRSRQLLF